MFNLLQLLWRRVQDARAPIDLTAFAAQPDVEHPDRAAAEAAVDADAAFLEGKVVLVREAETPEGTITFDPPVRARVYDVVTEDRWRNDGPGVLVVDPYVDFTFLDPVDPHAFPWHDEDAQYGWAYGRSHRCPVAVAVRR